MVYIVAAPSRQGGMTDSEMTHSSRRSSQPSSPAAERTAGFSAARAAHPRRSARRGALLDVPVAGIMAAVAQVAGGAALFIPCAAEQRPAVAGAGRYGSAAPGQPGHDRDRA
jgi:hypothetical protein